MATSQRLIERVEDFNNLCDSILSASRAGHNVVILDADMVEIVREHRILNNAVLASEIPPVVVVQSRKELLERANHDDSFFFALCDRDTEELMAIEDEATFFRGA